MTEAVASEGRPAPQARRAGEDELRGRGVSFMATCARGVLQSFVCLRRPERVVGRGGEPVEWRRASFLSGS